MKSKWLLITFILVLGIILRFYKLGNIPNGIDIDEASQGYDAYSILKTGKDRYGESLPVFMRSFGNYQSPLYTYLTVVSVSVFSLSVFATRFVSAMAGVIILICTFFLVLNIKHQKKFEIAVLATLFTAVSPWAILFSRTAVEANLALCLLIVSVLLFVLSLKKYKWLFIAACIFLALSTYAYPAERVISVIFLFSICWIFKKYLFMYRKISTIGIILFLVILTPQLLLINSPGSKSRINQVQYWSNDYFEENDSHFRNIPFGKELFVLRKFSAQYITYFSPKNLFFDADEQPIRSIPDLSTFYPWMIIPLFFGIRMFLKERVNLVVKTLFLVLVISPIPAAATREPFYTLRALPLFWVMTIVISFGMYSILEKLKKTYLKSALLIIVVLFSLILLYSSYFILLKYERMASFGQYNIQLLNKLTEFKNSRIIVDSTRANLSMWYFFTEKVDPNKLQRILRQDIQDGYYSSGPDKDYYQIDNIEFKPINFGTDVCKGSIIVGDPFSISDKQSEEHNLKLIFEIKDLNNIVKFKGYSASPNSKC